MKHKRLWHIGSIVTVKLCQAQGICRGGVLGSHKCVDIIWVHIRKNFGNPCPTWPPCWPDVVVPDPILFPLWLQMFGAVDTEDFLSSLLGVEDSAPCLSHSPLGSDSGISDDSGHNNACHSPGASDSDPAPSPALPGDAQSEAAEAVQTDHCYSLQQPGDGAALQSVRSERPDNDVFIDLGTAARGPREALVFMGNSKYLM